MKKAKAKIKKVMKGLQKASKTHAAQAKTLKGVLHGRSKKKERVRSLKALAEDFIRTKILEIPSV
jgi:hypothetical protein